MVEALSTIVRRKPEYTRLFLFAIHNPTYIFLAGSPRFQPFGETRPSRHARRPRCACAVASPSVRVPPVAPASVCVPARSAPWLAQSRRIKPEVPRVRGRHGCPADEDCVETDQDLPLLLAVAHPHKVEAARKGSEASWI